MMGLGLYWDIKVLICNALFGGADNLALHMEFYARAVTYIIISLMLTIPLVIVWWILKSIRDIARVDISDYAGGGAAAPARKRKRGGRR